MKVVEWKCHVCNRDIPEKGSDVCSRCGRHACTEHMVFIIEGKARKAVCTSCLKEDDTIDGLYFKAPRACNIFGD